MYGEEKLITADGTPTLEKIPELNMIVGKLQHVVSDYEYIVRETRNKLQMIKRYDEPSTLNAEDVKDKQPESVTDELNRLLNILLILNEKAESNLRHLNEIV